MLRPSLLRAALAIAAISTTLVVQTPGNAQAEVVPASECVTPARPITFLGDLVATPVPESTPEPLVAVPAGEPLPAEAQAEISATIRQIIACSNSGDLLRAFALFSDSYLRRIVDPTGELEPDVANELANSFATPTTLNENQLVSLVGIREMVLLPDGRVAVVVETDGGDPDPDGTDVDLFILEKHGDAWLVADAVNDIDELEGE